MIAVATLLAAGVSVASHDLRLAQIVADHQDEIVEHGHSHDDIVDAVHAYFGHSHDVAEHDHNTAVLPNRTASATNQPTLPNWRLAHSALPGRNVPELDRPPRG